MRTTRTRDSLGGMELQSENGWRPLMAGGRFSVREDTCSTAGLESCARPRVTEFNIGVRNCTTGLFALAILAQDGRSHHRFGASPRARDTVRGLGH